jgi:multiple sugar transport system substrate-binding protein
MKQRLAKTFGVLVALSIIISACATPASPTPQVVEVTRIVQGTPQTLVVTSPPQTVVVTAPAPTAVPSPSFKGTTVNIITFTGPQIAEPLQRRAPDFERLTGASINVITVPFSDLYEKVLTDASTGTNSYDAYVFDPQWLADFATPGYLLDLTDRVKADTALDWNGIAPFFRNFSATYNGKVYTIPLDGDFEMVYYRKDIFDKNGDKPPVTWDDYINLAKKYQGQDLNGDGTPDYGSCISMKRGAQGFQMFPSIALPYIQSQGTAQGGFFTTDTMQPLFGQNEAMTAALNIYKTLSTLGPPNQLNMDVGDTRTMFITGRCALSLDWGDIGPLSVDPSQSQVINQVGSVIDPGSKQVLDWSTGKLVPCDSTTCPNAVDGVNHAPYAAFGGWSCAINAHGKAQDAAYDFCSYISQPAQSDVDVTIGRTGFNPYRNSHFTDMSPWLHSGMSQDMANNYLGAIKDSLQSPNMVLDMRIPQTQYYQQVSLDTALAQFLAGELTLDQTEKQIADQWNAKTDEIGRDAQLAAYKASLGITK